MTETLSTELERAAAPREAATIYELIERQRPALERLLGTQLSADRFARIVTTEVRRTPELANCSPASLLGALMLSAQLGLEPGPLGHVYFVPYKNEVSFIVGYKGMIDLAFRSGLVKDVSAAVVREGDTFEWREGTRPFLDHVPAGPPAEREWTHVYAVGRLRSGGTPFRVLYPEDVEKARKRSPAASRNSGPWITDTEAMWRKTAVRRLAAMLPQSPALALALAHDETVAPPVEDADVSTV